MVNIVVPVTLQSRVIPANINPNPGTTPRQRAQSAGPRLMSTLPDPTMSSPSPALPSSLSQQQQRQRVVQSQSMQAFKTTIERPRTATTTSREHYTGANFGLHVAPPPRAATSFEEAHTNSMESLVSKYM